MMLQRDGFLQQERDSKMMQLDFGYLQANMAQLFERASKWEEMVQSTADAHNSNTTTVTEHRPYNREHGLTPSRIVIADAERTFVHADNRELFVKFLSFIEDDFADYAQGMGFVASILLLVLEESKALSIIRTLAHKKPFIPGYWQAEAVEYVTDGYVFEYLLKKQFPKVAEHFTANCVLPEMFCSKWFVGLCVHVLPLEQLFDFFEHFFMEGKPFLFKFGLSFVEQLHPQLLAADTSGILRILRLEKTTVDFNALLSGAANFDVLTGPEYDAVYAELFETKLRKRLEAAKRQAEAVSSDDEIKFSDEEDEEDEDKDD